MTILFDGTTIEAVASGSTPITSNGGPFSSVTQTNGTVLASNAQAKNGSISVKFEATGAGTAYNAITPSATVPAAYDTIVHSFAIYIHSISSTSTVLTLILCNLRYCIYLFNSSGWKIGFTAQNNGTNAKTGSEATSAAMTTGEWHSVTAIYKKVGTAIDLILYVDGVLTSTGTQTPASYTQVSGSQSWRIGSASQPTYDVNATSGDIFYLDAINITADPVPAITSAVRNGAMNGEMLP